MTPAAQVSAAIEVLADISQRRRPATDALKDWGIAHRFAGSKDRAAIASLVFDTLRKAASASFIMDEDTPRAKMLGALREARGIDLETISSLFSGEGHAPMVLTPQERVRLETGQLDSAPDFIRGDYPEWLSAKFSAVFGHEAAAEGSALAMRAPIDLRVNILKGSRDQAYQKLAHLAPVVTPHSPLGLRLQAGFKRGPAMTAETTYVKGFVELQDEASQLASLLCAAAPGEQVLDLCAGGGGKTLALAGQMHNRGQIYAFDAQPRRLMPIHERLERAGARNIQVRAQKGDVDALSDLVGRCDLTLIDAPCTGTGTWRRHPDAKWRLAAGALTQRLQAQSQLFDQAARYVKPGGRLAYITCSVLIEENEAQVIAFIDRHPDFSSVSAVQMAQAAGLDPLVRFASQHGSGLRFSPRTSGTDGFFVALLQRDTVIP